MMRSEVASRARSNDLRGLTRLKHAGTNLLHECALRRTQLGRDGIALAHGALPRCAQAPQLQLRRLRASWERAVRERDAVSAELRATQRALVKEVRPSVFQSRQTAKIVAACA